MQSNSPLPRVSGGQDGFAQMYDVQSGQLLQKLEHDSSM
jgi:hypothetical protein